MRPTLLLSVLLIASCSDSNPPGDCSDSGTERGGVYAIDAQTLEPICDIGTGLYGDGYTSLSPRSGALPPCDGLHEFGPIDIEDQGSFRLEVFADGYQKASAQIVIQTDGCGRQAVFPNGPRNGQPGVAGYVTVALQPE
ncbi:MAG: hypothetical protein H6718_20895 [Polyangiaceae bacterium]|nr:hypothetical protein [Polyangiaceae bacterium]MCB9608824.1 hypothetical protein [Polyangiaceae bacterium]